MNITFIGAGNMASALIGGLLLQGYSSTQIHVVEINAERREKIKKEFNVESVADLAEDIADSDIVLLAVKPQQLSIVAQDIAALLGNHLVISIAAGIRATDLSRWLGGYRRIVRAMPNTPALIRAGATGLYALPDVSAEEKRCAESILAAVGSVQWFEREELLDAVTAISGSGPAYVFYFIEAMQKAGEELGLDAIQARQLALETFLGAAKLASQSNENAAALRAQVTSPGGTTERAMQALEHAGVKNSIIDAIHMANQRSRELGDELGTT